MIALLAGPQMDTFACGRAVRTKSFWNLYTLSILKQFLKLFTNIRRMRNVDYFVLYNNFNPTLSYLWSPLSLRFRLYL
jgi:hypothetical protein